MISIHVPREGDDNCWSGWEGRFDISIHVPREGDDRQQDVLLPAVHISIHVPREGDDSDTLSTSGFSSIFQSTSPVRGTTR